MATDEREEEREFLDGLKARTGHDLAEWMAAIAARGSADRNEIIDWLRAQGMPFARASWLERIHRNGGKPIYGDPAPRKAPEKAREPEPRPAPAPQPVTAQPPSKSAATVKEPAAPSADDAASLEKLIGAAKGYRPLYHLLETEVRNAVPSLAVSPKAGYVSFGAPAEFAVITPHASELRLGLDLGDRPFDPLLQKAKLKGPGPAMTHMIILTDARQVNGELISAVKAANARVNG